MADSIELRASLNSLKRVDPYVKKILATATQVALYKFDQSSDIWEKTDKEGALFLYSRNGEPFHSIMILNRLNKDNFIEPLHKQFEYQEVEKYFFYKTENGIFAFWFFNPDEGARVISLIKSLMDRDKVEDEFNMSTSRQNGKGTVDIFSMLSKAQEDFNKTPAKSESGPPASFSASTPKAPDIASQSVMDFFAKAGTKTVAAQKPLQATGSGENVLHRLMSNPAHSVEHIEKQQRSATPQELSYRAEGGDRRSVPVGLASTSCPVNKFESFERVSPSNQSYSIHNQTRSHTIDDSIEVLGTSPFKQFLENAQKPLLMTPMMFSAPKEIVQDNERVEMLTEKQLAQALIHLLKTSPGFIRQIHQAYTNSILEQVDKSRDRSRP